MGRLVAVTGATGFVGPHLVTALARRGWRLRLLVRRWSPLPSLAGVDADLILGDLSSESALRQLVDGADAVIHAAGLDEGLDQRSPRQRRFEQVDILGRQPIERPLHRQLIGVIFHVGHVHR